MVEKDIVITFDTLYELLRREKFRPELQKLEDSFYQDLINYINEKTKILESQQQKDSIFAKMEIEKTKRQLENIQKIVKELYEKRETKIIQLALIYARTNPERYSMPEMLSEEKKFYESIVKLLGDYRISILNNILTAKLPELKNHEPKDIKTVISEKNKTKLVRILQALPQFVGTNLNTYGPFEPETISNLPKSIADLLIKKQKAQEIIAK